MDAITIAKNIFSIAKQIYDQVQLAKANQEQCKGLENRISLIVSAIPRLDQLPKDEAYSHSLLALQQKLAECLAFITQFSDAKWYWRILKAGNHQTQFAGLHQGLHQAIQQLNLGLSTQQILNREEDHLQQQQDAKFIKENQANIILLCTAGLSVAQELKKHQENILAPQVASIRVQMSEMLTLLQKADAKQITQAQLTIEPRYHIPSYELEFTREIGQGTFATVYEGRWDNQPVAIKRLKNLLTTQDEKLFIREIQILTRLNNPYIPRFFGANRDNRQGCLVMEYFPLGSLYHYLAEHTLTELEKLHLALHLAKGLHYLHRKSIIHSDFKSQNVLLTQDQKKLVPKIIDFGLARLSIGSIASIKELSRAWAWSAPEVRNGESELTMAADVYSFGTVLWELMTGKRPFSTISDRELILKLARGETESLEDIPKVYADMIQSCWQANPLVRPSLQSIVQQLETQHTLLQRVSILSTTTSTSESSTSLTTMTTPLPFSPVIVEIPASEIQKMEIVSPSISIEDGKYHESQGLLSEKLKDYSAAQSHYETAINCGSIKAKTNLAILLLRTKGGAEDKPRAAILLREAAKAGHVRAMHNLALMLKNGDGITADAKEAAFFFRAAAERDHAESMYELAKMLEAGKSIPKDIEQANVWYVKASQAGHLKSGYQSQRLQSQMLMPPPKKKQDSSSTRASQETRELCNGC